MNDRSHQAGLITLAEYFRFGIKSIIGIILARILTQGDLGSYRQLFLIYTTISTLMLMGIPQSLIYFLPKISDEQQRQRHIGNIMNLSLLLSVMFALVLLLLRQPIAIRFQNPQLSTLLIIYAAYPLMMFSTSLYSYVMLGLGDAGAAARFTIFSVITDAILILGAAFITRELVWIVSAVIAASFLQWLFTRVKLHQYRAPWRLDIHFYKAQFAYALPLGVSSLISMLSIQLDKIVVSSFFTPAQFAVFSIGAMELPFISILTNSVNSVLLPGMSKVESKDEMSLLFKAAVRKNALFILPVALLFYLYAPQIITLLYTDLYREAVPFFRVYLYILPLRVATFGMVFMALGKTRVVMYNAIFLLCSNLILNLILVKTMGMIGAAIATVVVTVLAVLFYMLLIKFKLRFQLGKLLPLAPLIKTALAAVIAFVVSYYFVQISPSWLVQALGVGVFIIVYLLAGYLFKAILPYDIELLRSFAGRFIKRAKA